MSIATVVTEGFGSFGDVAHAVTQGFDIGAAAVINTDATILTQAFGKQTAASAFIVTEGFQAGAAVTPPTGQVVQVPEPYGPARGWPLFRRKRCDKEHEYLCKEEKKLEKQLERPRNTELQAKRAEERRASLELVKARIAALQAQMDEDDFNDLMLIDELDDLED